MSSSNPRPKLKTPIIRRVTPKTRLHIDYQWWEESDLDLKTYLYKSLSIDDNLNFDLDFDTVDLIDFQTGEVWQVDKFQYVIQNYFSQLPDDFMARTSLVDAVFCVLLSNGNQPMTIREIAQRVERAPDVIIRTLGGPKVYQGIRPILEDE